MLVALFENIEEKLIKHILVHIFQPYISETKRVQLCSPRFGYGTRGEAEGGVFCSQNF
jgi:hypothetical protein